VGEAKETNFNFLCYVTWRSLTQIDGERITRDREDREDLGKGGGCKRKRGRGRGGGEKKRVDSNSTTNLVLLGSSRLIHTAAALISRSVVSLS
jgi:hypothetical protein